MRPPALFRAGDGWLAAACLALAGALLLVWIPLDVESGIIERARGRAQIGDSLAPSVAAVILGLAGLLMLFELRREGSSIEKPDWRAAKFPLILLALFAVVVGVFRWAGPFAVFLAGMFDSDLPEYRLLRDSIPWKYFGFCGGGFLLIFAGVALAEKKATRRAFLLAVFAPLIVALMYDLPFDDLLLPPNGDV